MTWHRNQQPIQVPSRHLKQKMAREVEGKKKPMAKGKGQKQVFNLVYLHVRTRTQYFRSNGCTKVISGSGLQSVS